ADHCQLSTRVDESTLWSPESYVTKRIVNVLPGSTGACVRSQPVEPLVHPGAVLSSSSKSVPCTPFVPRAQSNVFFGTMRLGGTGHGGPTVAGQPQMSRKALFTLIGFMPMSNEMFPSVWLAGNLPPASTRLAMKKSLYWVQMNCGHS